MKRATANVDAALSAVKAQMAVPRVAASAQEAMHPETEAMKRRLVVVNEHPFYGYACSWCGYKFPRADVPDGASLEALQRVRKRREKEFSDHVCLP
jgi:hypothetical protein